MELIPVFFNKQFRFTLDKFYRNIRGFLKKEHGMAHHCRQGLFEVKAVGDLLVSLFTLQSFTDPAVGIRHIIKLFS